MDVTELRRLYANRKREFSWLDLSHQDLTGITLENSILRECNLGSAILVRANLRNARLPKVNLNWGDLGGADLSGAKLIKANLVHVNFTGANLSNTDLRNADLQFACFNNANLLNTNFGGANLLNVDWGNADRDLAIFALDDRQYDLTARISEIIEDATTSQLPTMPEFQERWHYKPEDLLSTPQKIALSPVLWLAFIFVSYFYQGFFASNFVKQGFSFLLIFLSLTSPSLWLLSAGWYWLYPAVILGLILVTTFDWFTFFFGAIVVPLSLFKAIKYRAVLERVQVITFSQMSGEFQRRVLRDGLTLGLGTVLCITVFRSLFVQPGVVLFWLTTAIAATSGAIALDLLSKQKKWAGTALLLVMGVGWVGVAIGLGWRYAPNLN